MSPWYSARIPAESSPFREFRRNEIWQWVQPNWDFQFPEWRLEWAYSWNPIPGIGRNGIRGNQYILNNTKLGITQIGQPWFKRRHVTHFFPPPLSIPTTTILPRRRRRTPGECPRGECPRSGQARTTTTTTRRQRP